MQLIQDIKTTCMYLLTTLYQKGVHYSGIKIFNHLPTTIKNLTSDRNKFQIALKKILLNNSFYSLEEYFNT